MDTDLKSLLYVAAFLNQVEKQSYKLYIYVYAYIRLPTYIQSFVFIYVANFSGALYSCVFKLLSSECPFTLG